MAVSVKPPNAIIVGS